MPNKIKKIDFSNLSSRIVILSIITIIFIIILLINPETLYIDLFLIFCITIYIVYMCVKEIKNEKYRIKELSKTVDTVLKDNLNLLELPLVMLNKKNQIIWQNNKSKHLFTEEYIIETALKLEKMLQKSKSAIDTDDIGNGDIYTAIGSYIKFSDVECMLISFVNKTEEYQLRKTLENKKMAVGMIVVDNYDETLQGLDEIKKTEISTEITKLIMQWVIDNNGVLTKVDKDKYVIFVEKQYVDKMEKNSFKILERIRNISNETKLPITISIGMSYSEDNINERYSSSTSALDIAQGRGGDQAVVKKEKRYEFYGGSNLGLDKTNRVRARTIAQALREIIIKSDKVYVIGHKNSDIDCIGAAVGVYKIAESLGKEANIIIDSKCNSSTKIIVDKIKSNGEYENVFLSASEFKKQDYSNSLLVVVDTHKKSYLSNPEILDYFEKVVVIDHHRRGPEFIDNALLTYHEIYASSACELVTELLIYLDNIKLSPIEAESLYAGIVIDTKNFMFKTGVRTFEVAAYLKKYGIDITEVKQLFQSDFDTYIAKVEIVKNAEIIRGQIAISTSEKEFKDMSIIAAKAADELLSISGVLASFVLCKVDKVVMISGRSMGDINVQSILEKIGGGGHLTFAGAQIAGVSIDEAKKILLDSIDEYYGKD